MEPFDVTLTFENGRGELREYLLKPYFQPQRGADYFALEIPPDAESAKMKFKFAKGMKRAVVENVSLTAF